MHDLLSQVSLLRRPRLLVRTARIAAQDYRREARLPRILGYGEVHRPGPALRKLMCLEAELNDRRKSGDAAYSVTQHVDVLTALMAEAQFLRAQVAAQSGPRQIT